MRLQAHVCTLTIYTKLHTVLQSEGCCVLDVCHEGCCLCMPLFLFHDQGAAQGHQDFLHQNPRFTKKCRASGILRRAERALRGKLRPSRTFADKQIDTDTQTDKGRQDISRNRDECVLILQCLKRNATTQFYRNK